MLDYGLLQIRVYRDYSKLGPYRPLLRTISNLGLNRDYSKLGPWNLLLRFLYINPSKAINISEIKEIPNP